MKSLDTVGNTFFWWYGFVEDVNDPLKIGRCKVRIVGLHVPNKNEIPTKDLPWAHPMMPYHSASSSGVGFSPTGILPGTWVIGFFKDGESCQQPMILGTFPGINKLGQISSKSPSIGFNDPNGIFPKDSYIDESDVNKLSRNEDIENTIVKKKKDDIDDNNPTALGGDWIEPETPYAAEYPKNHVYESESGHIFEVDDTPNAERIHRYHRTGTFEEIHPDGTKVEKIIGNDFLIVRKNNHLSVYGNLTVNVGDTVKIYSGKNLDIQVGGDARIHVAGNTTMQTDGNYLHSIKGTAQIISGGNMILSAPKIDLNPPGVSPGSNDPGFKLNKSSPSVKGTEPVQKVVLELEDGTVLECDETREIKTEDGWKQAKDLTENDSIVDLNPRVPENIPISPEELEKIDESLASQGFSLNQREELISNFSTIGAGQAEIDNTINLFVSAGFNTQQITSLTSNFITQGFAQVEITAYTNKLTNMGLDSVQISGFVNVLATSGMGKVNITGVIDNLSVSGLASEQISSFVSQVNIQGAINISKIASDFNLNLSLDVDLFANIQTTLEEKVLKENPLNSSLGNTVVRNTPKKKSTPSSILSQRATRGGF